MLLLIIYFPDTQIENTGTYDNTQLQTGPTYGADQSSYGVIDASQRYYPVCISCFSVSEMFL